MVITTKCPVCGCMLRFNSEGEMAADSIRGSNYCLRCKGMMSGCDAHAKD